VDPTRYGRVVAHDCAYLRIETFIEIDAYFLILQKLKGRSFTCLIYCFRLNMFNLFFRPFSIFLHQFCYKVAHWQPVTAPVLEFLPPPIRRTTICCGRLTLGALVEVVGYWGRGVTVGSYRRYWQDGDSRDDQNGPPAWWGTGQNSRRG
jgi:hypothetical protein